MSFINYELYRIFYVVANSGSITKAANELFISQPAVSQSIKQLETQIGGRLFKRTSKGMELTYEGEMIYDYIKQANELIGKAEKKFSQLKELTYGEIKIGASDTITKHYLLKYIKKFIEKYPDISVKVTNRTSGETLNLLKSGKVDIGFVNAPIKDDFVNVKNCVCTHDVFVCNADWIGRYREPLSIEQIAGEPLIMLEKLSNTRRTIDEYMESYGVTLNPMLELGSLDLMLDMAKVGLGIACAPKLIVEEDIKSGVLYQIPIAFDMPQRAFALVTVKGAPLNYSALQFVNSLDMIEK